MGGNRNSVDSPTCAKRGREGNEQKWESDDFHSTKWRRADAKDEKWTRPCLNKQGDGV